MQGSCLVTGCAGFIGSHLSEALLSAGLSVTGIDNFADYYDHSIKERNLEGFRTHPRFQMREADLNQAKLDELLDGVDYVFHLAGQAGVRASWGESFDSYMDANIRATQRLLEACKDGTIKKFVYASSSSVYGTGTPEPLTEESPTRPYSPYGVTKLAAEHLCQLYARNYGVPTISLRYFTVFGPRQRPDMGIHRFIHAGLTGQPITVFGDGTQTRDFTYVGDIVAATQQAAFSAVAGDVINVGGGASISVRDLLEVIAGCVDRPLDIRYSESQPGDVAHTLADIAEARRLLGYRPTINISDGVRAQAQWLMAAFEEVALARDATSPAEH